MKILSFGSLNLDHVYAVPHFVQPGETLSSDSLAIHCGGKGLNQSIALARAGAKVYHAGAVGAADGSPLLELLAQSGVDTRFVRQLPCPSGHAIIQVNRQGQNCILLYGGANQQISREQIRETLSFFEAGDLLILQNEINELPYLMEQAGKMGMVIVLNPSPMSPELLKLPLQYVQYFLLNEIEAQAFCGEEVPEAQRAEALLKRYPDSHVLVTLGSRGCVYADARQTLRCPALSVHAVDTTAAGDTFTGYFAARISEGTDPEAAIREATKAAAIAVTRPGAAPSIPLRAEVLQAEI